MRPKRLAVVPLALAVGLGRALVVRLLLSPTGVVVGGAAPLPRAAASERRAAELLGLAADGAGRRAVAVELAVALALALAAVYFFWCCLSGTRLARALAKATFAAFCFFFGGISDRTRRPQRCKLVINLGQVVLLRLPCSSVACGTPFHPIIRGSGGLESGAADDDYGLVRARKSSRIQP